jgi:hypothetical protein
LVLTGRRRWKVYLVPLASEHDARLGDMAHATVGRVTFDANARADVELQGRELLRAVAREQVIHDWEWEVPREISTKEAAERQRSPLMARYYDEKPKTVPAGAAAWLKRTPKFDMPYVEAVRRLDAAIDQSASHEAGGDLLDLVKTCRQWMIDAPGQYVRRMSLRIAVGSALDYYKRPQVIYAEADALSFAFHAGGDDVKEACREAVRRIYSRGSKEQMAAKLQEPATWLLRHATLEQVGPIHRNQTITVEPRANGLREADCKPPSTDFKHSSDLKVMAITPLGVKLFPWLAGVTHSALIAHAAPMGVTKEPSA